MAAVAPEPLCASGLPAAAPAHYTGAGRHALLHADSIVDPSTQGLEPEERTLLKMQEISKMKGQSMVCERNAKLICVNTRYIVYAMKEGFVRVINQNGEELFKLNNTTKAHLIDLAIGGSGTSRSGYTPDGTVIYSIDEEARVTAYVLEALPGRLPEARAKTVELVLDPADPPLRVIAHPTDNRVFVTMHATHLEVWSLVKLEPSLAAGQGEGLTLGVSTHRADDLALEARASHRADLPAAPPGALGTSSSSTARSPGGRLLDVTVTVGAACLVGLAVDGLFVWRLVAGEAVGQDDTLAMGTSRLELLQHLLFPQGGFDGLMPSCVRVLRPRAPEGPDAGEGRDAEVLVLGLGGGATFLAYELAPASPAPVGQLLQCVRALPSAVEDPEAPVRLEVNATTHDSLVLAFHCRVGECQGMVLVMPLARGWAGSPGPAGDVRLLPLPYAQRLAVEDVVHLLTLMTGKSYQTKEQTTLLFRVNNFTREKDGLPGVNILMNEVTRPSVFASEEPARCVAEGPAAELPGDAAEAAADAPAGGAEAEGDAGAAPAALEPDPEVYPAAAAPPAQAWPLEPEGSPASLGAAFLGGAATPPPPLAGAGPEVAAAPPPGAGAAGGAAEAPEPAAAEPRSEGLATALGSPGGGPPEILRRDAWGSRPEPPASPAPASPAEEDGAAGATSDAAGGEDRAAAAAPQQELPDLNWGFIRAVAASFVKGLEKRRGELADTMVSEVAETIKPLASGGAASADLAALEQALAKISEAREAQAAGERGLQSSVRKAADSWAEQSSLAVTTMMQKELSKISEGVATTLAQQLSQSRRFCEALAKGVQRAGGAATKQALESLRPQRQIQDAVGSALTDALHESLGPVFKAELRAHFEKELAPLISDRMGEMMAEFRTAMGDCLEGIAAEQEQAARRLGQDLAPVVAEELRQVQHTLSQQSNAGAAGGISEAQMDELARAVQVEVIHPLHLRIQELSEQVRCLRDEANALKRHMSNYEGAGADAFRAPPGLSGRAAAESAMDSPEAQAAGLERMFREGRAQDAFVKAIEIQQAGKQAGNAALTGQDFLGRLCSLVTGPLDQWLGAQHLSAGVKMLLLLMLVEQLEDSQLGASALAQKVEWITELWYAFDAEDEAVASNAANLCQQLKERLERLPAAATGSGSQLNSLKRSVNQTTNLLTRQR